MSKATDELKEQREGYFKKVQEIREQIAKLTESRLAYEGAVQAITAAIGIVQKAEDQPIAETVDELAEKRSEKDAENKQE
jgi:cytochrome c556